MNHLRQSAALVFDSTLWRWLQRAVAAGLLCRQGAGRKSDPFRYWLPGQEKFWEKDPLYCLQQNAEAAQAKLRDLLAQAR